MNVILFDGPSRQTLLPLTFTRPVAAIRIGILTIAEKWEKHLAAVISYKTEAYLASKFPEVHAASNLFINGALCPDAALAEAVALLKEGQALIQNGRLLAVLLPQSGASAFDHSDTHKYELREHTGNITLLEFPEHIFSNNDAELRKDFDLITRGRSSAGISASNTILGDHFFAEEGAEAECSTFNTRQGPVYLGRNAQVWEGCHIRGSFALCHDSQIKMGAKIYGMTTIGPYSRVGGEINNAVIFGYSSKGHEGYLGNSVLGEWCNIGADSNNSNLKNNYAEVRLWDYGKRSFRRTGLQFCGLIMADHAKCAINTMFNTGTVIGVSANVFGSGFPRNFVPDFAWGGAHGFEVYSLEKMFETAQKVLERRNKVLDETEKNILTEIFKATESYRHF